MSEQSLLLPPIAPEGARAAEEEGWERINQWTSPVDTSDEEAHAGFVRMHARAGQGVYKDQE